MVDAPLAVEIDFNLTLLRKSQSHILVKVDFNPAPKFSVGFKATVASRL